MANMIREVRKSKGVTLEALAEKLDSYPMTIQRFESGTRNVSLKWLERIADALGVKVSDLVDSGESSTVQSDLDRQIFWIIEACVAAARKNPSIKAGIIAGIGTTTYRGIKAGELPELPKTPDRKKPPESIVKEIQRLLDYEEGRLS